MEKWIGCTYVSHRVENVWTAVLRGAGALLCKRYPVYYDRYYHFDRYYLYVIHVFDDHELLLHKHNLKNDDDD